MAKDDIDRDRAMRRYQEVVDDIEGYEDEERGVSMPQFASFGYGAPEASASARKTYPARPPTMRAAPGASTDELAARALERVAQTNVGALKGAEAGQRAAQGVRDAGGGRRIASMGDDIQRQLAGPPSQNAGQMIEGSNAPPLRGGSTATARFGDVEPLSRGNPFPPEAAPALMAGDPSRNAPPTGRFEDQGPLPAPRGPGQPYVAPIQPVMMNAQAAPAFPGAPPAFPLQQPSLAGPAEDIPGYMTPEEIAAIQESEQRKQRAVGSVSGFGQGLQDLNSEIARIRAGYDYAPPRY